MKIGNKSQYSKLKRVGYRIMCSELFSCQKKQASKTSPLGRLAGLVSGGCNAYSWVVGSSPALDVEST